MLLVCSLINDTSASMWSNQWYISTDFGNEHGTKYIDKPLSKPNINSLQETDLLE